jgi:hypothetical protein
MCCVLILDGVVGNIHERVCEKEILQLCCRESSFESCAKKTYSFTTASQKKCNLDPDPTTQRNTDPDLQPCLGGGEEGHWPGLRQSMLQLQAEQARGHL